jgi:hypothetical protein
MERLMEIGDFRLEKYIEWAPEKQRAVVMSP